MSPEGKKSLGMVVQEYLPMRGGIATLSDDLARFASRECPVVVFLTGPAQEKIRYQENITVIPLGERASPEAVFQALEKNGITHVLFNHFLCAPLPLVWKCRRAGLQMWTYVHGADVNMRFKNRFAVKTAVVRQLIFRLQNGVLVNSRSTQRIFSRKFLGVKSRLIHPGIWLSSEAVERRRSCGTGIVTLGRLVRRKGFDVLLEAVRNLKRDVKVTIIGDGPDREFLRAEAIRLGISEQVRFLRGLSNEEVVSELLSHRVFCLLPRVLSEGDIEGFGIVFLEAAVSGLPVVAGRSGGVPDAVNDGINGFLVDPEDPLSVAERLDLLLTDDNLCRQMGSESLAWVKKFDWNRRNSNKEFSFLS